MSKEFLWPNRARSEARIDKTAFWEKFSESLPDQPIRRKEQSWEEEKVKSLPERLHEEEPEPRPERESKIVILYDGLLSAKMEWDEKKLAQLADWADLRSQVIVRCGQERPKAEYFSLGEVAAWRAFGNPLDFLKRKSSGAEEVNFSTVEKFNAVLNHSLRSAIWKEKGDQAVRSLFFTSYTGVRSVGLGSLGLWLFKETISDIINVSQLSREYGFLFAAGSFGIKSFLGSILIARGVSNSLILFPQIREILNIYGRPYFCTVRDLNPLKHLKDGLKGSFYLSTTGRKLVNYKKSHL